MIPLPGFLYNISSKISLCFSSCSNRSSASHIKSKLYRTGADFNPSLTMSSSAASMILLLTQSSPISALSDFSVHCLLYRPLLGFKDHQEEWCKTSTDGGEDRDVEFHSREST
ncbi:hypothetical protein F2Q68_00011078 [Brassica cretica]|uniref:Uncharacterized protein n=1 Tax=Brassica cretica TaxID=69181 RepID=A0A8S9L2X8_BRACR|nr:hypothetical protein F2Q68_00011078 [Brassica cretica]